MKKNILGIFAIATAVSLSAFTAPKNHSANPLGSDLVDPTYYEYQSGPEAVFSNYNSLGVTNPGDCPQNGELCWIRVSDSNGDGNIDATDFNAAFTALDGHNGGTADGSLDDENADNIRFSQRSK